MAVMKATTDAVPAIYKKGERFCQLVIVPVPEYKVTEASELTPTNRGENGYGSTGITNEDIKDSAATGSETQASEQSQTEPEPAAADKPAEVSEEQA